MGIYQISLQNVVPLVQQWLSHDRKATNLQLDVPFTRLYISEVSGWCWHLRGFWESCWSSSLCQNPEEVGFNTTSNKVDEIAQENEGKQANSKGCIFHRKCLVAWVQLTTKISHQLYLTLMQSMHFTTFLKGILSHCW